MKADGMHRARGRRPSRPSAPQTGRRQAKLAFDGPPSASCPKGAARKTLLLLSDDTHGWIFHGLPALSSNTLTMRVERDGCRSTLPKK